MGHPAESGGSLTVGRHAGALDFRSEIRCSGYSRLVHDHLDRARGTLDDRGVISAMTKIIAEVYVKNASRHDPLLGDDATTFGITTSRNIANLAVQRLNEMPGVSARLIDTALEVLCGGYVLRQYKLPGATRDVSVNAISWDDSEAKLDGAVANSATGQLSLDADWAQGAGAFGRVVPAMRHLRLAHAADVESGDCVIYLGIPRDNRIGGLPWFDVVVVFGDAGDGHLGSGTAGDPVSLAGPAYDQLPLPEFELVRRPGNGQQDAQPGAVR
jgi:hypothetical protein